MTAPHEPVDKSFVADAAAQPDLGETDSVDEAAVAPCGEPDAELAQLRARLEEAQGTINEQQEQLLRARADAENARRRAQEDVSKAHKFGIESFAENLVPVKDSLEAALSQTDQTAEALREGVAATLRQLSAAFERNRLKEIVPAQGDKFDPHLHQAISSVPAPQPANTVVQTLQKGYAIADRTLRPALVTVSAGQAESTS
jgi:molecular chaperone GrpE